MERNPWLDRSSSNGLSLEPYQPLVSNIYLPDPVFYNNVLVYQHINSNLYKNLYKIIKDMCERLNVCCVQAKMWSRIHRKYHLELV